MRGNVSKRKSNTGIGRTDIVKKGTLSNVDIRTVCEAGIYKVENDCTGMPTELNDKSIYFGMTLIVMPWGSKSTDLYYNQYLFVNGYGTDEVNSLFVNQIFSQNGNVSEELKWTKIASSDLQSQLDEVKNAANHPNKNVLNAIDEHKINLWDNGVEILNNHKFYTQSLTESLLEDMIIFYKNADWCAGVYMFIPESNVEEIHLENQNGDIAYSISGTFEIGYIYIIRFGETSEIISKVPFEPVNRVEVQDIIKASELKWQLLNEETVIEDVKTYTYTLPEKCKGIIVDISVPKALDFNASTFNIKEASTNHWHMDQGYTWGKTGATQYNKVLRVYCKPENGYYNTTYADNSGSHPNIFAQRWTGATPENKRIDTLYLGIFELTSSSEFAIPAGTVIKVWGLIEQ